MARAKPPYQPLPHLLIQPIQSSPPFPLLYLLSEIPQWKSAKTNSKWEQIQKQLHFLLFSFFMTCYKKNNFSSLFHAIDSKIQNLVENGGLHNPSSLIFRWGTHLYISLFLSVHLSVHLSVMHPISGTVYHLSFFLNVQFQGCQGGKRAKNSQK